LQARKLEVALVDTTGDDDVHINDVLVNKGLAEYKTETGITIATAAKKGNCLGTADEINF
jgi:hypothetical protein